MRPNLVVALAAKKSQDFSVPVPLFGRDMMPSRDFLRMPRRAFNETTPLHARHFLFLAGINIVQLGAGRNNRNCER
jgi:hypothetical protein